MCSPAAAARSSNSGVIPRLVLEGIYSKGGRGAHGGVALGGCGDLECSCTVGRKCTASYPVTTLDDSLCDASLKRSCESTVPVTSDRFFVTSSVRGVTVNRIIEKSLKLGCAPATVFDGKGDEALAGLGGIRAVLVDLAPR